MLLDFTGDYLSKHKHSYSIHHNAKQSRVGLMHMHADA